MRPESMLMPASSITFGTRVFNTPGTHTFVAPGRGE